MVSDDSLTDIDDSYFNIYSTKTVTTAYYGFLEKLKSDYDALGYTAIFEQTNRDENEPCSSKDTSKRPVNLNDPCSSKDTSGSRFGLNDPCTSKETSRSRRSLNDPCTSKEASASSIILDDSSGSTIILDDPCTSNEANKRSTVLVEENDLKATPNNPSVSTPAQFSRIRFRKRTGRRRRRARGKGTGKGRDAVINENSQQTSDNEVIEVSPVPKRRRTQGIPEVVELSDDDAVEHNLTLEDDINYEVSVKVLWMSVTVKTFRLRRFQKFTSVFEYFMKEENVPYENILLKIRDIRINSNDTPDSLDLKVCDFIDGGILSEATFPIRQPESMKSITNDKNCLIIKLQDKTKVVHKLTINKDEQLKILMIKYAEQTEIPLEKLKFYYDGEIVRPTHTPNYLGMSNDEIIDVKY